MALWQCYGRYLRRLGDIEVEEITEENDFVKAFFSNGFEAENAGFTVGEIFFFLMREHNNIQHKLLKFNLLRM